jgi:hypothetical protein
MRVILTTVCLLLATCFLGSATTIVDPFGSSTTGDVIGDKYTYDIQKIDITVTSTGLDATLYFNYNGTSVAANSTSLPSFGTPTLSAGDLFLYDPSNNHYLYALPLSNHGSFTAGHLYSVTSTATAGTVYGSGAGNPGQTVWITGGTQVGTTFSLVINPTGWVAGGGSTNPENKAVVHVAGISSTWLSSFSNPANIGVVWENATCANDIISGFTSGPSQVPEPGPMSLMGVGFAVLAGVGYWRRKTR